MRLAKATKHMKGAIGFIANTLWVQFSASNLAAAVRRFMHGTRRFDQRRSG